MSTGSDFTDITASGLDVTCPPDGVLVNDVLLIGGWPPIVIPEREGDGEGSGMPGVCLPSVGLGLGGRGACKELSANGNLWVTERGDMTPGLLPGATTDERHMAGRTAEMGRELEPDSRLGTGIPPEFEEGLPVGRVDDDGGMLDNWFAESGWY